MASRAAQSAIASWGGPVSDITHIIFGTMSAVIDAPTIDNRLINSLDLPRDIRRLSVQQMGCLTGFRCLTTAAELAASNPAARILVVVADVRSGLQNQLPHWEESSAPTRACIISCALFRDAASAVIVGSRARPYEQPRAKVLSTGSAFLPGWHNSKELPDVVSAAAPELVARLFKHIHNANLYQTAVAMHPGGPKILQLTAEALGLQDSDFAVSWQFLREHGNTSGSSNLALLHNELIRAGTEESPRTQDILCIGIGPGMALEGLLLRRMEFTRHEQ